MIKLWFVLFILCASQALGQNSAPPEEMDTLVVSAPQVTVEEVIAAISRRMEHDGYLMKDYEYTTLITQVLRDDPGVEGGDYTLEEFALRHHFSNELGAQVAKLWERSRKFENGQETEEELDEEVSAEFIPADGNIIEAMPFSPSGGHKYNYTILDRQLVGNNLIYKVSFVPKVKFEALPTGTIWVDYSNWVVRKFEAAMTGAVPYPMFLKSVPVYRMSQERFGDFWFPTEVYLRINLREIPLIPMPNNIEVRVSLRDIVINGEALSPEDTAPGTANLEITAEEIAGGFWLSEEANNDTLSTYWGQIGEQWEESLTPEAIPITLETVKVDSLTTVGSTRLHDLREGNLWRLTPDLVNPPDYNRTQGVVTRVGLTVEKLGPDNPRLDLTAGYAFANKRPVYSGELDLPLWRSRWKLADAPDDGREYLGSRYKVLSLRLAGRKDSGQFAGDGRRHTRSASSFFYGGDPNHYFEERVIEGDLSWRLSRGLVFHAGGGYAENRAWQQQSGWNVFGRDLRPSGNLAADFLDDTFMRAGAAWEYGPLQLEGEVTWHDFKDTPVLGGQATRREVKVGGELDLLDGLGNQWLLRGSYAGFDGSAPAQMKTWLGDYGSLRGYGAGVLTGDEGAYASLDTRFGFDLFKAAKIPLLKNWGLQPIGFMDWGKTWDHADGLAGPPDPTEGARGWRMDVGFGFGKRFDLPGLGEFRNVRLYAAHPVGEGSDGLGWRILLAFEK